MKRKSLVFLGMLIAFLLGKVTTVFAVDLLNYSVRSYVVGDGNEVTIEGFVVNNKTHKMLIRVQGPSLPSVFEKKLLDPVISVYRGSDLLVSNDDWASSPNSAEIVSSGLAPSDPRESAIIQLFEPGSYTVVVSGKGKNDGVTLLEIYDLGEVGLIYDNFSGSSVDLNLWQIKSGNPYVNEGYFYCTTNQFVDSINGYMCKVETLFESNSWGVALQNALERSNGTLGMQVCVGMVNNLRLCGVLEVQRNGAVVAKVVNIDSNGTVAREFFVESLSTLTTASFFGIVWNPNSKALNFLSRLNESSVTKTITWFGNAMDSVYQRAPLEIYSVGNSPVTSIFPVAYVER
ncbi:MAG: hypothetical protein WHS38_09710 [Thermodesulforhabdaceae bacterium]